MIKAMRFNFLCSEVLQEVYENVKLDEPIDDILTKKIVLLFEDPVEYERITRLDAGCRTYSDEDNNVRDTQTKEIVDW